MNRIAVLASIAFLGSSLHAQSINVRGKVSGSSGPLSGAAVELVGRGLKGTTGTDGSFSLTGSVGIRRTAAEEGMSLEHGVLRLALARPAPITVEVFDLQGNQLRMESLPNASVGAYSWDFAEHSLSDQMMIIKASIGRNVRTFRYRPMADAGSESGSQAGFTSAAAYLAKAAAVLDKLRISAAGYATLEVPIGTWDTTVNATLTASSTGGNSAGCGKTSNLKSGKALTFSSGGANRTYNLRIPEDYDKNKPYRLIVSIHWLNGTANNVSDGNSGATFKPYYGLWDLANPSGKASTTIFVAPQGQNNSWPGGQVPFITSLVEMLKGELCIDNSRIFAEGFSMGGSMSYALACEAPDMFRAVAVHSGGPMSGCNKKNKPVAYFMTHGTKDGVCTYPGYGVPQINDFAKINGCEAMDIPNTLKPTNQNGMDPACADFKGCSDGHPTRACIFVGDHTPSPGGSGTWVPAETWKFISQF